jgi:hypothetical protein
MRYLPALLAAVTGLAMFAGPAALPGNASARHYLDRHTGATFTVMERPLVFARERSALAVNARDYISLVAIDINRGGQHQLYWYGYIWSTIAAADQAAGASAAADWMLLADARPIQLHPVNKPPRDLGIAEPPLAAPVRNATPIIFSADAEELEYLGAASGLALRRGGAEYQLWRDARAELASFLGHLAD